MSRAEPDVIVCAGGGGVGKTTTSAALALALARSGRATLIVTIDPARRLAGAMGARITDEITPVTMPEANGALFALMPDPRRSLHVFAEQLFEHEPEARARLKANQLFNGLADAAAGVHELVAINLIAHAAARGAFDAVVVDTAPSRHAVDFVTMPGRLASLLNGRAVAWLAGLTERAAPTGAPEAARGGLLRWGAARVEALLAHATGPVLLRDTADLFRDLATVRERFVALTEHAGRLLLGPRSSYVLVTAPTAAARADAQYLHKRLEKLGARSRAIVMNRADTGPAPHTEALRGQPGLSPAIREALALLEGERQARSSAADAVVAELRGRIPGVGAVRLPFIEAAAPERVVAALSRELEPHLGALLPPPR